MMKKINNWLKITSGLSLVIVAIMLFHYFHIQHYLSVEGLNNYSSQISFVKDNNPYQFIGVYFLIYFLLIICCIPGTIILDIIAGFLFGTYWGSLLIIISYTLSTCGNYFVVDYILHDFFVNRLKKIRIPINQGNQRLIFISLTALRFIPIIPFWAINLLASLLKMRFKLFIISTAIGIFPIAVIYALVGDGMKEVISAHHVLNLDILTSPKLWVPLALLAITMLLPGLAKVLSRYYKRRKQNNKSG